MGWGREVEGQFFFKSLTILISCLLLQLRIIKFNIKQFSHEIYWHQGVLIPTYAYEVLPHVCGYLLLAASPDHRNRKDCVIRKDSDISGFRAV